MTRFNTYSAIGRTVKSTSKLICARFFRVVEIVYISTIIKATQMNIFKKVLKFFFNVLISPYLIVKYFYWGWWHYNECSVPSIKRYRYLNKYTEWGTSQLIPWILSFATLLAWLLINVFLIWKLFFDGGIVTQYDAQGNLHWTTCLSCTVLQDRVFTIVGMFGMFVIYNAIPWIMLGFSFILHEFLRMDPTIKLVNLFLKDEKNS